jgi:hypothetical protein
MYHGAGAASLLVLFVCVFACEQPVLTPYELEVAMGETDWQVGALQKTRGSCIPPHVCLCA